MQEIALMLHNIRSSYNVGSIFRTSDAAGVSRVFLTGYTPRPIDRFGRVQKEIHKTALGAELSIPWKYYTSPSACLTRLKKDGWRIVGVEQDVRASDYRELKITQPTVLVFGNEVRGLSQEMRRACDALVEIPMHGSKESLNVSVAVGIILFSCIY